MAHGLSHFLKMSFILWSITKWLEVKSAKLKNNSRGKERVDTLLVYIIPRSV